MHQPDTRDDVECKVMAENVLLDSVVVYGVGVEQHQTIVLLKTVRDNVQPSTQRDDADGKLMVNHVLLLLVNVVVYGVGVGPHQIIVLLKTVKATVNYPHLLLHLHPHPHLHPHFHTHNVELKRVAGNVLKQESVVVYGVGVEPQTSIVLLDIVRNNVQVHTQRDDADGKLMVNHVLLVLDSVVVTVVGVGPHSVIALLNTVKANATLLLL
ncbi:hypothetical protein MTR67_015206 [Solanum verrucosum]|uniref:Uncharacterized protein n=1 Tax=Solanum verrucosum TaxID=315347 RepID=A0AAF0QJJ7_SOLVR|nr:hypothetical protein MTR67_015206 [Solanum verrucosum]